MNKDFRSVTAVLAVLFVVTLLLVSCSGGGGSSGPPKPVFRIVMKDITTAGVALPPAGKLLSAPASTTGETGSVVDSMLAQVSKFELKKGDGTWVTVYSGSDYLEFIGASGNAASGSILGTMPAPGSYAGYRLTTLNLKIKLQLVQGGTRFYTTTQSVTQHSGNFWNFSQTAADYGYVTFTFDTPSVFESDFPSPLTVTDLDTTLYYVEKRAGTITCEGSIANTDITGCTPDLISEGILPAEPKTMMQFDVTATSATELIQTRSNTITAYFGAQDNFLGATGYRHGNWYFCGGIMTSGSALYSSSTQTGSLDLTFMDGDGLAHGTYNLTTNFDCGPGTYSSLALSAAGTGTTVYTTNYTLHTTGAAACSAI